MKDNFLVYMFGLFILLMVMAGLFFGMYLGAREENRELRESLETWCINKTEVTIKKLPLWYAP